MNTPLPSLRRLIWLLPFLLIGGLTACKTEKPRPPVSGPKLETRADGLTYKVGENQPFTGTYKSYHKTSNLLVKETPYLNGQKDGLDKRWFPENPAQLEAQRLWVRGEPMFHWRWWPNGNQREISAQRSGEKFGRADIAYGSYVKWFEDGRMKFKAIYDENFQWHGRCIDYDDTGKLMWDAEFKHGVYVSGHRPPEEPAAPAAAPAPAK